MTTTVATRTANKPRMVTTPKRRRWPTDFVCKLVMSLSGIVFGGFVLVHMLGNLKAYLGPAHFDDYAMWLRHMLEPLFPYEGVLWVLRVVLLACLVGHVGCAYLLTRRSWVARGRFRRKGLGLRSFAARTMPVSGVVLLLFIVFHILDLTTGTRPIASAAYRPISDGRSFAYDNLVHSFERPWASGFYIAAMLVLGLHVAHGLRLAVNDLGATGHRLRQVSTAVAGLIALAVMVGNISLPIAVLTGVVS